MTHPPVCPKELSEHLEEKDLGPAIVVYSLMPAFTHGELAAAIERDGTNYGSTNTRDLIKNTFYDLMGGIFKKDQSQDLSSAGRARLLILHAGGPYMIKSGTHKELCKKYGLLPPTLSRELRKVRELLHDYRIPHAWNPLFWTPAFKPQQRTPPKSRYAPPPRAPRGDSDGF